MKRKFIRFLGVLSAVLLLVASLGQPVQAEQNIQYTACRSQDECIQVIREAVEKHQEILYVQLSTQAGSDEDAEQLGRDMLDEAVGHCGIPYLGDYRYFYSCRNVENDYERTGPHSYTLYLSYVFNYRMSQQMEEETSAAVKQILGAMDLENMSEYGKAKAIYTWLTENVSYDFNESYGELMFTPYSAIVKHTAVCEGFAEAFYRLALTAGLDARVVKGYADGVYHARNIVRIGSRYYYLDATWDRESTGSWQYFLLGSRENGKTFTPETDVSSLHADISEDNYSGPENEYITVSRKAMYRMYNPVSGEHFFTASMNEVSSLQKAGWKNEGIAWYAPVQSDTPVYRLYNADEGEHLYTASLSERDELVKDGWKDEGIGWYSGSAYGPALYRLYNSNGSADSHHYTNSAVEKDHLVKLGWTYEGVGWNGAV